MQDETADSSLSDVIIKCVEKRSFEASFGGSS